MKDPIMVITVKIDYDTENPIVVSKNDALAHVLEEISADFEVISVAAYTNSN